MAIIRVGWPITRLEIYDVIHDYRIFSVNLPLCGAFYLKRIRNFKTRQAIDFFAHSSRPPPHPPPTLSRPHQDTQGHPRPPHKDQDLPQGLKYSKNSQKTKSSVLGFLGTANTMHGSNHRYGHFLVHIHGHEKKGKNEKVKNGQNGLCLSPTLVCLFSGSRILLLKRKKPLSN